MRVWWWRYLPPNVVTCLSLVIALFSISESIAGEFESAAWFLLLCVLLDKADGSVARLFKASSRFGVELDSLADLIAFGVAPSILVLSLLAGQGPPHGLEDVAEYRRLVYVGSFFFVVAAALRLAKFNVMTEEYGKSYFFGIPTTLCGAMVGTYYLTIKKYGLPDIFLQVLPGIMIALGLLMVSRVPLPKMHLSKSKLLNILVLTNVIVVYLCGVIRILPEYLFVLTIVYMVVGSLWSIVRGIKPPPRKGKEDPLSVDKFDDDEYDALANEDESQPT